MYVGYYKKLGVIRRVKGPVKVGRNLIGVLNFNTQ